MRTLRAIAAGALLGLGISISALTPAAASDLPHSQVTHAARVVTPIAGEPWSSPAHPVECVHAGRQVNCTPAETADAKATQCFTGVYFSGASVTACTSYEGHIDALKGAGGKPLIVEYGCSLGDVVCITFENAGRGVALASTAMMFTVVQNMSFDTSTLLWTAAVGEWSFWQWAILIVVFVAMVWAVAHAVVSGDRAELVGALTRSFIAIPAVPLTLWMTGHLLNAIDEMTWYILNRDGPWSLFATLQGVMWAGGQANYFFALVIHLLVMAGMLLLMLVFAFRNIALAALIAVGPIAWMLFPVRGVGPQWVVRYVSAVAVLLLTGPLTIGFMTLIINGLADVRTIWDPRSWPLLIGLVLVAFAPFAVFGLFSFVGAVAADSAGSRLGSGASRGVANFGRAASRIPSRIGGRPAGIPATSAVGARAGSRTPSPPRASTPDRSPNGAGPTGRRSPAAAAPKTPAPPSTAPTPPSNGASRPPAPKPEGRSS